MVRKRSATDKPLFQEPPEDLGPDDHHGFLIGGMCVSDERQVARSYWMAGDALVDRALADKDHSYDWAYPIMYIYRHALELYLKLVVKPAKKSHKLEALVDKFVALVKTELKVAVPDRVKSHFREIAKRDPNSTSFRYADKAERSRLMNTGEAWVEFRHLQAVTTSLFQGLEEAANRLKR